MIICLGSYYIVYLPAKNVKSQLKSTNRQKTNKKTTVMFVLSCFYRVNFFSDNTSNVSSQHLLGFTFLINILCRSSAHLSKCPVSLPIIPIVNLAEYWYANKPEDMSKGFN